ncbi:MAG: hypothetical protein H6712_15730 [Myxococcales bacterium]|nr:hypothetical protein [Myxococcales bacterium]MCB9715318.1 hypothetical protein [Myxococcales bacterium]
MTMFQAPRHGQGPALLASLGLALGLGGCNELQKIDDGGSSGAGIPDEVQRVFDERCNTSGCHDSAQAGGLELSAAVSAQIIDGPSEVSALPLVELGNVPGSYLAVKLLSDTSRYEGGVRMPFGADFEDPAVLLDNAIVIGWIAGAELPGGGGGGGMDTEGSDSSGDGSGSTAAEIVLCGLDDVAPGEPNAFDIGMDAGQIPPDVGAALTANCGCHELGDSAMVVAGAIKYAGQVHFSTIAELQADYMGRPVYEVMQDRLEATDFSQMPPNYFCSVEGGEPITAEDQQLLIDWLMAGAPDAPSWNPA